MGLDASKISRHHRTVTAIIVLCEGREANYPERAELLNAMWEGWREVMHIRLGATLYSEWQERKRQQSG